MDFAPEELEAKIQRAKEFMKAAEDSLKKEMFFTAASRAYYALFNLLIALLLVKGLRLPRTHSGLLAVLWNNREILELGKEEIMIVQRLLELREEGDYGFSLIIDKNEVSELVSKAREIFEKVVKVVEGYKA